jgi:hypothetical protein
MMQLALMGLVSLLSSRWVAEPTAVPVVRPITEAETVLAIMRHDFRLASTSPSFSVILVIWPDGHTVWSGDCRRGGPPYYSGQIEPQVVAALLARFDSEELFSIGTVNAPSLYVDAEFIRVLVKAGKKKMSMQSSHELLDHAGVAALRKKSAEYLFYRTVWSETRARLAELIPHDRNVASGKPVMEGGVLAWHEGADQPFKP